MSLMLPERICRLIGRVSFSAYVKYIYKCIFSQYLLNLRGWVSLMHTVNFPPFLRGRQLFFSLFTLLHTKSLMKKGLPSPREQILPVVRAYSFAELGKVNVYSIYHEFTSYQLVGCRDCTFNGKNISKRGHAVLKVIVSLLKVKKI